MKIKTPEIISQAESYDGIRAGLVALDEVLKGPSYRAAREGPAPMSQLAERRGVDWPPEARTVMVLGLHHPENEPRLDWWERGDTWGNRRLRTISAFLKEWLWEACGMGAHPLPYQLEKGGILLKDAAVMSGIGIIGRSNLLLYPEWGPRVRLRSLLLEGDWQPTQPLQGFSPCETCEGYCQKACPVNAFPGGRYSRPLCLRQMEADAEDKVSIKETKNNGERKYVIKYCRACELSCPVGA
jgi:epoxyqueuosine reductase